ncbi:MAG: anhydro-N-acetylmuramic acid kinase [Acidimicrobiales bacterium]
MRVIGMISGTSCDAIEAVAAEITIEHDVVALELLGHVSEPYPAGLRRDIAASLPPSSTTMEVVCKMDTLVGQCFAELAGRLGDDWFAGKPDVVCSHGQTTFHWAQGGRALGTLQLGQAAWIAERTGATVVHDLRSRDVAAGGQGAPLASLLDVLLLGEHPPKVRAALNLGGIANVTVVGPTAVPIAFDTGPANALIDAAVLWLSDGADDHDHDGVRAARGHVDAQLLDELLDEPYYALPPPKSTGKELFHLGYLMSRLAGRPVRPDDLVATLTALTAQSVADALLGCAVSEVVVSGGGSRNPSLMAEIASRLPGVAISGVDAFGIPEASKEAVVFALLGFLTVNGYVGTVASCTGARRATILGSVLPGRQPIAHVGQGPGPRALAVRDPGQRRGFS